MPTKYEGFELPSAMLGAIEKFVKELNQNGTPGFGSGGHIFLGVVSSEATMLSIQAAPVGSWVARSDLGGQIFEVTAIPANVIGNWYAYPAGDGTGTGSPAVVPSSYIIPLDTAGYGKSMIRVDPAGAVVLSVGASCSRARKLFICV